MVGYLFCCCKETTEFDNQLAWLFNWVSRLRNSSCRSFQRGSRVIQRRAVKAARSTLCCVEFVLPAGLRPFAQPFSLLFRLYGWHLLQIDIRTLAKAFCRRQRSRRFPMQLYCRVPKTKEAAPPQVVVLTLPLFSRICECLVPYFDSTSSESRNVFVLWLHLVASPSILWLCLVSPVLPELCILINDGTLTDELLFEATVLCFLVFLYVFPLGFLDWSETF